MKYLIILQCAAFILFTFMTAPVLAFSEAQNSPELTTVELAQNNG
jgi:hypothetical protein